jgi:diguanylate cyclase (GGDEF)-like protein
LAVGAPLGLLALRAVRVGSGAAGWAQNEIASDAATYLYVALSTGLVFSAFGYALGRQADQLYELLITDPLTGLRNRRAFQARLEDEFARALRYAEPLSLLMMDLDGLKALNDGQGHRAGDAALRGIAAAIRSGARATDVGARWGGDEFALLAPKTAKQEALSLAERVRALAARGAETGAAAATISIGVATLDPAEPVAADQLLRAADAALYEAKRAGRNRVAG